MKIHWKKGLAQITFWLLTELVLNFLGLDDLADYSEYIFKYKLMAINNHPESKITIIANFNWLDYDSVLTVESM